MNAAKQACNGGISNVTDAVKRAINGATGRPDERAETGNEGQSSF
jgi:hypothetical protein